MNLADVMDDLASAIDTITGLRVTAYAPETIQPPSAWVEFPQAITFDETFGRGDDSMVLEVWVAVAKSDARTTRDRIAPYLAGSGASSIKAAIESYNATATAYYQAVVASVEFNVIQMAGTDYLAAAFSVRISGSGA